MPPPALRPGARVGVAALSGVVDREALGRGLAGLRALGFAPVPAANLALEEGLFAGSDRERLDGLHRLAADPSLDAIVFARGGHGMLRLLPDLDWELLASRPRWFVGYSDLTPFLMQVVQRLGWVALHGPMAAVEPARGLAADEARSLREALGGLGPATLPLIGAAGGWDAVEGPLVGGCLSLLAATLGTPWALRAADCILFLEDVGEPLYRVDRMLQQLRLAGALAEVRGIVLGKLDESGAEGASPEDLRAAVAAAAGSEVPVAWGCPSGHCRPNLTLPLGARARVEAGALRLVVG
ncbi:MAG: LD-carboxypeptidase [Acidobacteriota bacterium]|nr:LD-carboxypeptidase [Acidobacteriota bacterium]